MNRICPSHRTLTIFMAAILQLVVGNAFGQRGRIPKELAEMVSAHRKQTRVPALFVAVIGQQTDPLIVAVGKKKQGASAPVSADNKVHLGSCTKAMTALLAARLIDQKKIKWDSTIEEMLPELAKKIHSGYGKVTLRQLLSHRGGCPTDAKDWWLRSTEGQDTINLTLVREGIAIDSLGQAPSCQPGEKFEYSNLGYMVAGLMLGKAKNNSWEESIQQEVFGPLKMESAGFGIPDKEGNCVEPWGHVPKSKRFVPIQLDNAPALGPAGTLHMTLADWGKFLSIFATNNAKEFISKESFEMLTTPIDGDYAAGWIVVPASGGNALSHDGSNTTWYSSVWVFPDLNRGFVVVSNAIHEDFDQSGVDAHKLIEKLRRWDAKQQPRVPQ